MRIVVTAEHDLFSIARPDICRQPFALLADTGLGRVILYTLPSACPHPRTTSAGISCRMLTTRIARVAPHGSAYRTRLSVYDVRRKALTSEWTQYGRPSSQGAARPGSVR